MAILSFGKNRDNGILNIYVKEKDTDNVFISKDNGLSWLDGNIPEYFMTVENAEIRMEDGRVLITLQNNSDDILVYGQEFYLFRWDKNTWVPCNMMNNCYFTQMAYLLQPNSSCSLQCDLQYYEYGWGKYLLTKDITKQDKDDDREKKIKLELSVELVIE